MSGTSGPTSDGGDSASSDGGADACDIVIETSLFGPVPGVADLLAVGDVLEIRLVGVSPVQVGAFTPPQYDTQAGTIAGVRKLPTLIKCLSDGVAYTGTVIATNGSDIRVRIQTA